MDLIIGGCHQGKTQYVMDVYGYAPEEIVNGEDLKVENHVSPDEALTGKKCLNHFHLLVRRLLEEHISVEEYLDQLFAGNDIEVILTDEIGCGIVPIDAFEREYREAVGRQCCRLAQRAVRVCRVAAGIASYIKGSPE